LEASGSEVAKRMRDIYLPFSAWYGDNKIPIRFPSGWKVHVCAPRWKAEIQREEISGCFENPHGSERLRELARGRKSAVIIVDCLARPTPASRILPFIIGELEKGGIAKSSVKIIIGQGAHRPLTALDFRKKLGRKVSAEVYVANHNPFANLSYVAESSRGTPIYINSDVMKSELKIGVGCIIPHPYAGFGGGAKIVLPGVAGIETMEYNHDQLVRNNAFGVIENSTVRPDMEEVAEKVGLDFLVNVTINVDRKITNVFTGNFVKAHRAGVDFCKNAFKTNLPDEFNVLLANAYPLDVYLIQAGKAIWASEKMKEDGIVILGGAFKEGLGIHYLLERLKSKGRFKVFERQTKKRVIIYSENVGVRELREIGLLWHTKEIESLKSWSDVIRRIKTTVGGKVRVAVLPCGSIQF